VPGAVNSLSMRIDIVTRSESKHLPLSISIQALVFDDELYSETEKFVWDNSKGDLYVEMLACDDCQNSIHNATAMIDADINASLSIMICYTLLVNSS
jgi:hypothetical protein